MTARPDVFAKPSSYYFYLSYAHHVPLEQFEDSETADADPLQGDAEPVVAAFYGDLAQAVAARVRPGWSGIGFLDQDLLPGSDLEVGLAAALGAAQLFVPLYSPGYFLGSLPLREQATFRRRLLLADVDPDSRIVPVLWTPVPHTEQHPDVSRALDAAAASPVYRENGLRALFLLSAHRRDYEAFRSWLADEIVAVAERSPVKPTAGLNLEEVERSTVKEARFLVAMLGPGDVPARARPWWHGYALPVAQHAARVADRFGLLSEVAVVTEVIEAEQLFVRTPGIVLVDPWPAGDRAESVAALLEGLPSWVLPVVLEEPFDRLGEEHAAAVRATISRLEIVAAGHVETISDMSQLERILPGLVARAGRRYLRQVQIDGMSGPRRPRLPGRHRMTRGAEQARRARSSPSTRTRAAPAAPWPWPTWPGSSPPRQARPGRRLGPGVARAAPVLRAVPRSGVADDTARRHRHGPRVRGRRRDRRRRTRPRTGIAGSPSADRHALSLSLAHFPGGGRLDLLPAGDRTPDYARELGALDWDDFYDRLGGAAVLRRAARGHEGRVRLRADRQPHRSQRRRRTSAPSICRTSWSTASPSATRASTAPPGRAPAVAVRQTGRTAPIRILPVPMRVDVGEKQQARTPGRLPPGSGSPACRAG